MVAGLSSISTDVCGHAAFVARADAGRVMESPFRQDVFNGMVADALGNAAQRDQWRRNGIAFGRTADLYGLPERAAAFIAAVARPRPCLASGLASERTMTDTLYLREDLAAAWRGDDPFERVARLEGEVFRDVSVRRTLRFEAAGRSYFAKVHLGVGWREILKNLLVLRLPVVDASNEYHACLLLPRFGVSTPAPAAYGIRGRSPATRQSFIVCDELTDHVSLSTLTKNWHNVPPSPAFKRQLITAVAELTQAMHRAGVVHRDYYLYHLLVDEKLLKLGKVSLSLIDLHRAQLRRRIPPRWPLGIWPHCCSGASICRSRAATGCVSYVHTRAARCVWR